jgi:hypothetical protein
MAILRAVSHWEIHPVDTRLTVCEEHDELTNCRSGRMFAVDAAVGTSLLAGDEEEGIHRGVGSRRWRIVLDGPQATLQELGRSFQAGDPTVAASAEGYILQSDRLEQLGTPSAVREGAAPIVQFLSAIAKVQLRNDQAITLKNVIEVRPNGSLNILIEPSTGALNFCGNPVTLQTRLVDGSVEEQRPLDAAPLWLDAASSSDPKARLSGYGTGRHCRGPISITSSRSLRRTPEVSPALCGKAGLPKSN